MPKRNAGWRASGREVRYVQVPWDEFERQSGKELTLMYRWFQHAGYHVNIGAVRSEYPKLTTFERWMNSNRHTVTQAAR